MSGMSGGSMLRTRRKDVNVKPNRKLDRKSSRGMLYENEELRLRTININAEVERGQSDIKKLKRENDQLKREISSLRYEYDKLDKLLRERADNRSSDGTEDSDTCCSDCEEKICKQNDVNSVHDDNSSNTRATGGSGSLHVAFNNLMVVPEEGGSCDDSPQTVKEANVDTDDLEEPCDCEECVKEQNIPDQTESAPQPSESVKTEYCDVVMPYEGPSRVDSSGIVAPIFPKQGLDILINNNNNIFSDRPPIGFIIPNHDQFVGNSNIVPYVNENERRRFQTGGNVEDLLGDIESSSNVNLKRDAIVLFNTKKVIQQHTFTNEDRVLSSNCEGRPYYVTEKNIDLNYDYPKTAECSKAWLDQEEKQCKSTTTQTTLTTTEINSTVFMIDRPKPSKNMQFFSRSHSAPVEPIVEEPIYATVKKLPKKLRMVDLTNLEEEVAYNPSVNGDVNVNGDTVEEEINKEGKEESASISSSQPDSSPKPKKSSMKKKRFSIYFKRRSKATESVKTKEEQKNVSISTERLEGASESDTQKRNCQKHRGLRESRPSIQGLNTPPNGHACGADHKKPHKCYKRKKSIRSDSIGKHKYSPMRNYFKQDSYQVLQKISIQTAWNLHVHFGNGEDQLININARFNF